MLADLPTIASFALLGLLAACAANPPSAAPSTRSTNVVASGGAFPVIHKIDAVMQAKRSAPASVAPVTVNGVRYRVPHFSSDAPGMAHSGGYIEAIDEKTDARLWTKEIYRYAVNGNLEGDVQDVFIVSVTAEGASLKIRDELGADYLLPLAP